MKGGAAAHISIDIYTYRRVSGAAAAAANTRQLTSKKNNSFGRFV